MTTEKERLQDELDSLQSELDAFQTNPDEQVALRVGELETAMGEVDPRDASTPDNRSMYTHLQLLKEGILMDESVWVSYRIEQLEQNIAYIEAELEEL